MNLAEIDPLRRPQAVADWPLRNFTLRSAVVEHPAFVEVFDELARLHTRGREVGACESLLLVAQTGSGKTTVLQHYAARHPRSRHAGTTRVPVLLVATPPAPSVKTFAEAFLTALGDPLADRGTASWKTQRVVHYLRACGVELLFVDEFQHFHDGRRRTESHHVADWLKNLINEIQIPVVLSGLPRAVSVVNANPQLRRRFSAPRYLRPFAFDTVAGQHEFRAVLKQLRGLIPIECVELHEANLARRFHFATNGLIDFLIKILDEAVSRCAAETAGKVELRTLEAAFVNSVWRDVPPILNPFHEGGALRPLTKRGEPFDLWDDPSQYLADACRKKL